eukprot:CAMPEP_0198282802 /NCGR_PEP_ID=MMETSP1449-20131203/2557_1 /TAXON_ID=420275 /ORGANISM="Attheya septentrionalis, Strain CCMP2084" /LENGTH=872 /DNA_ID=CAMNT_0043979207 /DNA_START=183 /DNA_END=2798 /DNA_ORIENTATION=-
MEGRPKSPQPTLRHKAMTKQAKVTPTKGGGDAASSTSNGTGSSNEQWFTEYLDRIYDTNTCSPMNSPPRGNLRSDNTPKKKQESTPHPSTTFEGDTTPKSRNGKTIGFDRDKMASSIIDDIRSNSKEKAADVLASITRSTLDFVGNWNTTPAGVEVQLSSKRTIYQPGDSHKTSSPGVSPRSSSSVVPDMSSPKRDQGTEKRQVTPSPTQLRRKQSKRNTPKSKSDENGFPLATKNIATDPELDFLDALAMSFTSSSDAADKGVEMSMEDADVLAAKSQATLGARRAEWGQPVENSTIEQNGMATPDKDVHEFATFSSNDSKKEPNSTEGKGDGIYSPFFNGMLESDDQGSAQMADVSFDNNFIIVDDSKDGSQTIECTEDGWGEIIADAFNPASLGGSMNSPSMRIHSTRSESGTRSSRSRGKKKKPSFEFGSSDDWTVRNKSGKLDAWMDTASLKTSQPFDPEEFSVDLDESSAWTERTSESASYPMKWKRKADKLKKAHAYMKRRSNLQQSYSQCSLTSHDEQSDANSIARTESEESANPRIHTTLQSGKVYANSIAQTESEESANPRIHSTLQSGKVFGTPASAFQPPQRGRHAADSLSANLDRSAKMVLARVPEKTSTHDPNSMHGSPSRDKLRYISSMGSEQSMDTTPVRTNRHPSKPSRRPINSPWGQARIHVAPPPPPPPPKRDAETMSQPHVISMVLTDELLNAAFTDAVDSPRMIVDSPMDWENRMETDAADPMSWRKAIASSNSKTKRLDNSTHSPPDSRRNNIDSPIAEKVGLDSASSPGNSDVDPTSWKKAIANSGASAVTNADPIAWRKAIKKSSMNKVETEKAPTVETPTNSASCNTSTPKRSQVEGSMESEPIESW